MTILLPSPALPITCMPYINALRFWSLAGLNPRSRSLNSVLIAQQARGRFTGAPSGGEWGSADGAAKRTSEDPYKKESRSFYGSSDEKSYQQGGRSVGSRWGSDSYKKEGGSSRSSWNDKPSKGRTGGRSSSDGGGSWGGTSDSYRKEGQSSSYTSWEGKTSYGRGGSGSSGGGRGGAGRDSSQRSGGRAGEWGSHARDAGSGMGRQRWQESKEQWRSQRDGEGQPSSGSLMREQWIGDMLYGVSPVLAALKAGRRTVHTLYLQEGMDIAKRKVTPPDTHKPRLNLLSWQCSNTSKDCVKCQLRWLLQDDVICVCVFFLGGSLGLRMWDWEVHCVRLGQIEVCCH